MHQNSQYSFENFIIQCCKAKEWDLRDFLKKKLKAAGFTIFEDNYVSRRTRDIKEYYKVKNLLAVRGNPKVCLVAHTDVCRDHGWREVPTPPAVFPVLKNWGIESVPKMIIQDRDVKNQTGGDDRLGVAINTWIALNTGYDMALLFTTDEEVGLVSADQVKFKQLIDYDLLVQVDRGNHSRQLVTKIGSTKLCSNETATRLLKIAKDMGVPREEVMGLCTDVQAIIRNGIAKEAVNMTCGYHNSFGDNENEYIIVEEARQTMHYVNNIIKYYDLDEHKNDGNDNDKKNNRKSIITSDEEEYQQLFKVLDEKRKNKKWDKKHNRKKRRYIEEQMFN